VNPDSSLSGTYRAPFAVGGPVAIDEALCGRLLTVALSKGGDYADLFFEYRAGGGLNFEEGILRTASRGVSLGVGVRVQKGDATGYAYVEDMEFDAMKRAAETAARIADADSWSINGINMRAHAYDAPEWDQVCRRGGSTP